MAQVGRKPGLELEKRERTLDMSGSRPNFVDATEIKTRFGEYLKQVDRGEVLFVRRRGVLVAAVIPWEDASGEYLGNSMAFMLAMANASRRDRLQRKFDQHLKASQRR